LVGPRSGPEVKTEKGIAAKCKGMEEAFKGMGVRLAFLFGSVLGGGPTPARDVDIAVLFAHYSFADYLALKERLSEVLGVKADELDLVVLDRANPRLKLEALLKGAPLFIADAKALDEFSLEALFEYDEYRRFKREYLDRLGERLKEGLSMAERKLDRERVEGYLSKLDEAVERLVALRKRFSSFQEFEGDIDTRELCVHYLRIALECVLDVCRHFLAVKGVSLSEIDTTNLIELAGEKGLIERDFARRIRGMAGMRNAIVHVYWQLDYGAIYEAIAQRLEEFDEFARQVKGYLEGSGD
jgi:uncharacterized protein YutE (UPF0331/DUF86 family)/predicted nucleotidyltransferase